MSKQRVDKYAEKEVLNGKSHQEIFNHIASTSNFKVQEIAEIVRKIPTLEKRKQYQKLNTALLVILGLFVSDKILLSLVLLMEQESSITAIILPVVSIFLFYGVFRFKRSVHLATGIFMIAGVLTSIIQFGKQPDVFTIIGIIIPLIGAIIAFYLNTKLVSDYKFNKELQESNPAQREGLITFLN